MEKNNSWCELPFVKCPHCDKEFHVDDYGEIEKGDVIICHHCDKEIYVTYLDYIISVNLSTHKED